MVLVGNKTDLREDRLVSKEEGFDLATRKRMGYCEVSAKKGDRIEVLFESIIENIQIHEEEARYDR